jgi:hypothetical protein
MVVYGNLHVLSHIMLSSATRVILLNEQLLIRIKVDSVYNNDRVIIIPIPNVNLSSLVQHYHII